MSVVALPEPPENPWPPLESGYKTAQDSLLQRLAATRRRTRRVRERRRRMIKEEEEEGGDTGQSAMQLQLAPSCFSAAASGGD